MIGERISLHVSQSFEAAPQVVAEVVLGVVSPPGRKNRDRLELCQTLLPVDATPHLAPAGRGRAITYCPTLPHHLSKGRLLDAKDTGRNLHVLEKGMNTHLVLLHEHGVALGDLVSMGAFERNAVDPRKRPAGHGRQRRKEIDLRYQEVHVIGLRLVGPFNDQGHASQLRVEPARVGEETLFAEELAVIARAERGAVAKRIQADAEKAVAESLASENASRLASMQNAEKNIAERLTELTRQFHQVRQAFEEHGVKRESEELAMLPTTYVELEGREADRCLSLMEDLEDYDDAQNVFANLDIEASAGTGFESPG